MKNRTDTGNKEESLSYKIVGAVAALVFFVFAIAAIPILAIPGLLAFYMAKRTHQRAFKLAVRWSWLIRPLRKVAIVAVILIILGGSITSIYFYQKFSIGYSAGVSALEDLMPDFIWLFPFIAITLYLSMVIVGTDNIEYEQAVAGYNAEKQTLKHLRQNFTKDNGWIVLDSHLFVFNQNQDNEWSAEVDHIVIGGSAIYLVETKYKSGTIYANADAAQWKVEHFDRQSSMRNALKQSQNSAKVLKRELKIPGAEFIPVVSIVGNDVQVVGGPSNVVACEDVATVIVAIERSLPNKGMNQAQALEIIERHSLKDSAAMDRHIARAQAKRAENERKNIFENAAV